MRIKLLKTPLLLPFSLVILCLFSLKLYAGPLHFIAYGDTRRNGNAVDKPQTKHNAIAKVIQELNPDFVLFSGDMVYDNEFEKFLTVVVNNYATDKRIPLYPVIGNHEVAVSEKLGGIEALIKAILMRPSRVTDTMDFTVLTVTGTRWASRDSKYTVTDC